MLMPVLTPSELWEATGRIAIPELFHLKDRNGRDYILPLTHEETVAFQAREIRSYKELPQIWYHFQTKDRDEPRPPRRPAPPREFIMKDGYSFDRDEAGLDESFQKHSVAYKKIFERCGLETYEVAAESGIMGGSGSKDFLAPTGSGENTLVTCENGDYAADLEIAQGRPITPEFPEELPGPQEVETPGQRTIEDVSEFLGVDPRATAKAMPVVADGRVVLALVRGDDRLNEMKLLEALGEDFRPAEQEEIQRAFGAFRRLDRPRWRLVTWSPTRRCARGSTWSAPTATTCTSAASRPGRDFEPRFADLREIREEDACPECGGSLHLQTAIEVGHIFKLETKYSAPLEATFLDEDGSEKVLIMGSYGIGPAR
jgi:prolyl-tRNA synthetase